MRINIGIDIVIVKAKVNVSSEAKMICHIEFKGGLNLRI